LQNKEVPKLVFPKKLLKHIKLCLEIAEDYYIFKKIDIENIEIIFLSCPKDNISYFFSFEHLLIGCPKVARFLNTKESVSTS